ncbi:hypothetical protein BP5796_04230 [Coleophoma crateriformis]|uniref:Nephrocystin 3-like N-terminal domain-containing protein n=1 Tax=Coleophoma crateriformis TaxID=565419 RepID=A0A3D8SHT0_9HELO|nr:hypothetical protein BP5796_04230 [Coleophoma crateriformis]
MSLWFSVNSALGMASLRPFLDRQLYGWRFGFLTGTSIFLTVYAYQKIRGLQTTDNARHGKEAQNKCHSQPEERVRPQIETGLKILYEGNHPTVDIVTIHGIGANPDRTWVSEKVNWLEDKEMLQRAVPNTRILRFGYHSRWLGSDTVDQRLSSVARQLVIDLSAKQRALTQNNSLRYFTTGVIFLGTPHRGSKSSSKADQIANIAAFMGLGARSKLLATINEDSDIAKDMVQDFTTVAKENDISLFCFYEELSTDIAAIIRPKLLRFLPYRELMVNEHSASLDLGQKCGLSSDHFNLNKFAREDDTNFERVRDIITDLVIESDEKKSPDDPIISKLPVAKGAEFDTYQWEDEGFRQCHPSTRVELLSQIKVWGDDSSNTKIFWLNGMAGTGKSTISRTVAKTFSDDGKLAASFFFKRGEKDRGNATKLFTTIAAQLVRNVPALGPFIRKAIKKNPDIFSKGSEHDHFEKLIRLPLSEIKNTSEQTTLEKIIVIDALDECESNNSIQNILSLLSRLRIPGSVCIKIFLTSRPELDIPHYIHKMADKPYYDANLERLTEDTIENDIHVFLKEELSKVRERYNEQPYRPLPTCWPSEKHVRDVARISTPLFIFATTLCRVLNEFEFIDPQEKLDEVLQNKEQSPGLRLQEMYDSILTRALPRELNARDKEKAASETRLVVCSIVTLADPLSRSSLVKLLDINEDQIIRALSRLHSVFIIPDDPDIPMRLFHLSFREFFLNPERPANMERKKDELWADREEINQTITKRCLDLMRSGPNCLKRDICGLRTHGYPRSEIKNPTIDRYLPTEVKYACRYWVQHLVQSKNWVGVSDGDETYIFLQEHLLHWLEALSIADNISESISSIQSLQSLVKHTENPELAKLLHDIHRFILQNLWIIDIAPLQIFTSAVFFLPKNSIVRQMFQAQIPQGISLLSNIDTEWDACLQTLEGHQDTVWTVAFSSDGQLLASGSFDNTIKLWDPQTGTCLRTLQGHQGLVRAVAFSSDGQLLASGSGDKTIKLWDPQSDTGTCLQTLQGHQHSVWTVAFSSEGQLLASGSGDKTIKLWDPQSDTGTCLQTLEGHQHSVWTVAFSSDGQLLASGSDDKTIKLWDLQSDTGTCLQTLELPSTSRITYLSFDSRNYVLKSNLGCFNFRKCSSLSPTTPVWLGYSLDGSWIMWNGERFLWLPPKYRARCSAFRRGTVALGCISGLVHIFKFDPR